IRSENVLDGREAYAAAAERLVRKGETARQLRDDDEPLAPPSPLAAPDRIRAAGRMLEALFELTARTTDGAGLANLIEQLQLESAAREGDEPGRAARDLRALAALQTVLDELSADAPCLGELTEALAGTTYPPQRRESLVDVLDVLDARSGRWDHVFLVGAGEGQFPRRFSDSSLISEPDRSALATRGVVLDNRGDLAAREMLLFYLAASRPEVTLHVSYQRWGASGQDSAPGSFLLSLTDALGGMDDLSARGLVTTIAPGQFLPPAGDIATRPDALLTGLAGLFEPGLDPDGAAISWTVRNAAGLLRRTAEGIWAHRRRWSWGTCDAFDGLITHPALLEQLAAKFGPSAVFTPTELNSYGQCPWWFFARYVLG
ncbi:MAG: hypothetical protein KAX78_01045, partial [Phycisphaerae bacterium]|nr:hypothetical protein [Phycisphaerae bacterium]